MLSLELAIIRTLSFFDLYDRPLQIGELESLLWKEKASLPEITRIVKTSAHIASERDWIFLVGRESIVTTHHHRRTIEKKHWIKVYQYLHFLEWIPFIKMAAVCNNLAFGASQSKSDIDLFFVIQNGRIWMTRLLITAALHLLGVRRHGQKIAGRFCLSFFVSQKGSDLAPLALDGGDDVYLAFWTASLVPVIDHGGVEPFFAKNAQFIQSYFPQFKGPHREHSLLKSGKFSSALRAIGSWMFGGKLGDWLEKIIRKILYPRSLKKSQQLDGRSSVLISDEVLKFHNLDRRGEVRREWLVKCRV